MTLVPQPLQKGDKVMIVAPAGKLILNSHLLAVEYFQNWGLEVVLGANLLKGYHYFSGTDDERLSDLQQAIDDISVKAIFCARGGYGTTRIIDRVNFDPLLQHPKWIVGYSDITTLHFKLHNIGIESIHSIMPTGFGAADPQSIESLRKLLFGEAIAYHFAPHQANRLGQAAAPIIGGNLSLIADSLGTPSEIDTADKILFIEDLDEYLYKIDRMLQQLKRAGKLEGLAGLIVGHMTDMKDTTVPFGGDVHALINDAVKEYNYPVAHGVELGHEPLHFAIPCSRVVQLSIDGNGTSVVE